MTFTKKAQPQIIDHEAVKAEKSLGDFSFFVRTLWSTIDNAPLTWNWHIQALCDHLQALYEGKLGNYR